MWYGSLVCRQGRSRPLPRYQSSSRRRNFCRGGSGECEDLRVRALIIVTGENLHQDRRRRRNRPLRRHARVKSDPRVATYGDVDELNAWLGLARAVARRSASWSAMLEQIQRDLFALGARLADPAHRIAERVAKAAIVDDDVARLEQWIDRARRGAAAAAPVHPRRRIAGGATLHLARTVCRRAERAMVALAPRPADAFEPELLIYINRLSDLLFVMARAANHRAGSSRNRMVSTPPESRPRARTRTASGSRAQHYENFPVASRLLPARDAAARRRGLRVRAAGRRHRRRGRSAAGGTARRLDGWERAAHRRGRRGEPASAASRTPRCFVALAPHDSRRAVCRVSLLQDLLSAFRQDVTVTRYANWADVLDYCRRSANPVGRLVLRIAGYDDPALDRASDAVCTALQLTNSGRISQIDWRRGRLYVPREIWQPAGARDDDLDAAPADARVARRDCDESWQRTRALFEPGVPCATAFDGRLRFELRATWLGGMRILDGSRPRLRRLQTSTPRCRALPSSHVLRGLIVRSAMSRLRSATP